MAKVVWATGIDSVSGSLAKPKKKDGHSCGNYLLGTHRNAASTSDACNRMYIRKETTYDRTTTPSADEIAARVRFAAVAAAVKTRSKDLMSMSSDQAAFLAQKDTAGGKKTLKAYYWKVCGDAYDQQHPRS